MLLFTTLFEWPTGSRSTLMDVIGARKSPTSAQVFAPPTQLHRHTCPFARQAERMRLRLAPTCVSVATPIDKTESGSCCPAPAPRAAHENVPLFKVPTHTRSVPKNTRFSSFGEAAR